MTTSSLKKSLHWLSLTPPPTHSDSPYTAGFGGLPRARVLRFCGRLNVSLDTSLGWLHLTPWFRFLYNQMPKSVSLLITVTLVAGGGRGGGSLWGRRGSLNGLPPAGSVRASDSTLWAVPKACKGQSDSQAMLGWWWPLWLVWGDSSV